MNYGLPYKGSKNKLATRIVELLPPRKHFYDLFCGGCAVTHAAMMTRKWEDFTINDLNWQCPTLFIDALNGKYKDDTRWISREDFFRLKDSDPYVAFVWSFGNNLKAYLYSKEIEPLKRAIHFALFFGDYEPSKQLGCDLSFIDRLPTREQKYSAIRKYFKGKGYPDNADICPKCVAAATDYLAQKPASHDESMEGWDDWEEIEGLEDALYSIEDLAYELRNCVRGANTNCKTWAELSKYVVSLADALRGAGEDLKYKQDAED